MADKTATEDEYALKSSAGEEIAAPELSYRPRRPQDYRPKIALVGTGGIAPFHLRAYRNMGFEVAALCNRTPEKAERLRDEFFPERARCRRRAGDMERRHNRSRGHSDAPQ